MVSVVQSLDSLRL